MKNPDPQQLGAGRIAVVVCAERPGAHPIFVRNAAFVRDWLTERGYQVTDPVHARRGARPLSAAGSSSPADTGGAFRAENMAAPAGESPAGTTPAKSAPASEHPTDKAPTSELPALYTDEALHAVLALDPAPRLVLTLGGTGLHPSDQTPQLTAELVDWEVPGIMHAIWRRGLENVDNAVMSRGTAGVTGQTFILNLPSSKGGIRDGLAVLDTILHLIQQQIEDKPDSWTAPDS